MGKFAYRAYLDGLRGISVTAVVLFHIGNPQFREGFLGVDVFFVLSGYLITSIILVEIESKGVIDIFRFYARRARRILPGAAVTIIIVSIFERIFDLVMLSEHGKCILSAASYWANFCFIIVGTDYWQQGKAVNPLKHYWSLSIEEQFYLFYPFGLLVILVTVNKATKFSNMWKSKVRVEDEEGLLEEDERDLVRPRNITKFLFITLFVLVLCALCSYVFCIYLSIYKSPTESHMNSFGRIYQLFSGGILSILLFLPWSPGSMYLKFLKPLLFRILSLLSLLSLLFLMFYPLVYEKIRIDGAYSGLIVVALVVVFIFSMETELKVREIIESSRNITSPEPPETGNNYTTRRALDSQITSYSRKFLRNSVLVYLGKWSYSIYLWHFPVIIFGDMLGLLPGLDGVDVMRRISYVIIVSLSLGIMSYYTVERTFMRIPIDTGLRKKLVMSMGILVPLTVVVVLYFFIIPHDVNIEADTLSKDDVVIDPMVFFDFNKTTTTTTNVTSNNGTTNTTTTEEEEEEEEEGLDDPEILFGSNVFMFGDSVCNKMVPMLMGLSDKIGFNFYRNCIDNSPTFDLPEYYETVSWRRDLWQRAHDGIVEIEADLIIVESNILDRECHSGPYWIHYHKGMTTKKPLVCVPNTHDGYRSFMVRGVTNFINILDPSEQIPLVFLPPNPRAGKNSKLYSGYDGDEGFSENPKICLQRIKAEGKEYVEGMCDKEMYHPYFYNDVLDALVDISHTRKHTKVVDWEQWVCPDGICVAKVGDFVAWADDVHFSVDYAVMKANEFYQLFQENGVYLLSPEQKEELLLKGD